MAITPKEITTIKKFRASGKSIREISRLMGRDRRTIRTALNSGRKKSKKEKIWTTIRHSRRFTYSDIERLTGCSRGYILDVCKGYREEGLIYQTGMKRQEYVWAVKPNSPRKLTMGYLPCPFCGSKVNILKDGIYCSPCEVKFIFTETHDQMIKKKWNQRK